MSNIEVENVPTKHVNTLHPPPSPAVTGGAGLAVMRRHAISPTVLRFDREPNELCDPVSPGGWKAGLQPNGY